jgi:hypothetical protein
VGVPLAGASTLSVYVCDAELVAFATFTANVDDPTVVGVPESVAMLLVADVSSERPSGNVPEARLHVKGPLIVVEAVSVSEYELEAVASGKLVGIIWIAFAAVEVVVEVEVTVLPDTTTEPRLLKDAFTLPSGLLTTTATVYVPFGTPENESQYVCGLSWRMFWLL